MKRLFYICLVFVVIALALFVQATIKAGASSPVPKVSQVQDVGYERSFCSVKRDIGNGEYVYFNVTGEYAWYYCGTIKSIFVTPATPFGADYDVNPLRSPVLCEKELESAYKTKIEIVSVNVSNSNIMCGENGELNKLLP